MPITIFFCYAREDEVLLNKLKTHLRPLQRQGLINIWYDREISAGAEWEAEIKKQLDAAQIVLLLVSPDFMDSDYCYGIEMMRALERHARGEATVIPIILHPVYWHGEPLGKLQALPTDGKPVTDPEWHNINNALYDVTQGIYKVVMQWNVAVVSALPPVAEAISQSVVPASGVPSPFQQGGNAAPFLNHEMCEKVKVLHTLKAHTSRVSSVALSADGATVVSASPSNMMLWDLSTGQEVSTFTIHAGGAGSVALSTGGATLVSASFNSTIKVWNLSTGQEVRTLTGHTGGVESVALSADGAILVSAGYDKMIKVWDLSTGQEVYTLTGHTDTILSVALSADGAILVSAGYDKMIKVWDLSTGQEVRTLTGHTGSVKSVALSANGATLISASWDETIKVWGV